MLSKFDAVSNTIKAVTGAVSGLMSLFKSTSKTSVQFINRLAFDRLAMATATFTANDIPKSVWPQVATQLGSALALAAT